MKIRFGYVSIALNLWDASPAKTLTYTRYKALGKQERKQKLEEVTALNLENTIRILHYNIGHQIELYRCSSSIVPLATHPDVSWDFVTPFLPQWREIGQLITKHHLRVSFHPNQFTLFTSDKPKLTDNAVENMRYHYRMIEAMNTDPNVLINLHVGGAYGDKVSATGRFHENLKSLPASIKDVMTLENDDKTYTTEETLAICQREHIPLMFDYHHHIANPSILPLSTLLPLIFETWNERDWKPKLHISSPRSVKEPRAHAGDIDVEFILPLLLVLKELQVDVDWMVEAKNKDLAMLKLIDELAHKRGIKRISGGAVML